MRNKAGQLAVVVPWQDAAADIQSHGGKIVTPLRHGPCAVGASAWTTAPQLLDGYGNLLAWDDRDLKPLGSDGAVKRKAATCSA